MASEEETNRCVWEAAEEYLSQSYDELARLEQPLQAGVPDPPHVVDCSGQEAFADIQIGKLGLFRPRICVEVTLGAVAEDASVRTVIVYFERFRSGKLAGPWGPSPRQKMRLLATCQ